jgi:phosphoglycolate phosphatase
VWPPATPWRNRSNAGFGAVLDPETGMTLRILALFDIDGTLVSGGPAKLAFQEAMVDTFGTAGDVEGVSFAGKTDPQIARELLEGMGLAGHEIKRGFPQLWKRYLAGLEARLPDSPMEVLPGVSALLDAVHASGGQVALGLVTGNILGGARLKLGSVGLDRRFPLDGTLVGGFGSDSEDRDHLPGIAIRRARAVWGTEVRAEQVVVIGDTPRDVACGQAAGTRTLAVATGHFTAEALSGAGADVVLEDLSDTDRVMEILT